MGAGAIVSDDIARKRMGFTDEPENGDVAITSVDCTPRAPSREGYPSEALYQRALMMWNRLNDKLESELNALIKQNSKRNRMAALQPVVYGANGEPLYFTKCACKWHGLRVSDPEVARREYDAHACSLLDANGRVEPGRTLHRKTEAPLGPAWVAETKKQLAAQTPPVTASVAVEDETPVVVTTEVDGTEQRMKLLELK